MEATNAQLTDLTTPPPTSVAQQPISSVVPGEKVPELPVKRVRKTTQSNLDDEVDEDETPSKKPRKSKGKKEDGDFSEQPKARKPRTPKAKKTADPIDELLVSPFKADPNRWDQVTDIDQLRKALQSKDILIEKQQNALIQLKAQLSKYETEAMKSPKKKAVDPQKAADTLKRTIPSQLNTQIQYRKGSRSGRMKVEIPGVSPEAYEILFPAEFRKRAAISSGKAQDKLSLAGDLFSEVFGKDIGKSLRYGASLAPVGVTATYSRNTETLKVSGTYALTK
eukprot:TRINITY_DN6817_c0_g1_i1.p1 TRINITY_DN6817_c0_g1~~TRINITY_DN6817_c0_g1_i1.p1  ORF type:complete len:306 (+),score=44.38 TRINITY_DN6817_c0_g1_i1:81-920(+)